QHLLSNPGNSPAQFGKPPLSLLQPPKDDSLPLPAEDIDGRLDGAIVDFGSHDGGLTFLLGRTGLCCMYAPRMPQVSPSPRRLELTLRRLDFLVQYSGLRH